MAPFNDLKDVAAAGRREREKIENNPGPPIIGEVEARVKDALRPTSAKEEPSTINGAIIDMAKMVSRNFLSSGTSRTSTSACFASNSACL